MQSISFSLIETLYVVALFPCAFSILLLLMMNRLSATILVPVVFFAVLSSSFLIGLHDALYPNYSGLFIFLVWVESIQPAICFLLVIQLWRNQFPPALYWLILALPIIGGTSLVIATLQIEDVCLLESYCLEAFEFRILYQFFATAAIFLLLIVHLARLPIVNSDKARYRSHRYWLIIAIIFVYTSLMLNDLYYLAGELDNDKHDMIHVIMRLCFIYLVLTSLFRVFDNQPAEDAAPAPKPIDPSIIHKIEQALSQDKLYREMNFSREQCAQKLEIAEHVLSRAINQTFDKNFNEFVNGYRIAEAKERLANETTSVTAIAFEVGFSSIASFNRVFKAMVGASPTEYRSENSVG